MVIAYKNGVTQNELAEWHDTGRRTIYSWLARPDTGELLEQAVVYHKRTRKNRKSSEKYLEVFGDAVRNPPENVGLGAPAWTSALPKHHLGDRFGVEHSEASCRRLLKEAGLAGQKPRHTVAECDQNEQEPFRGVQKSAPRWTPR